MPNPADFPAKIVHKTVTIANAATDSDAIDLQGLTLCGVHLPSGFDGTSLAFKTSTTLGGTYTTVADGAADIAKVVAASRYVALDPSVFAGIRFLKLVGGAQTGAVILTLALRQV